MQKGLPQGDVTWCRMKKAWAGQVMSARYNDMAYRIAQTYALQKYRRQFDLAQTLHVPYRGRVL